MIYLSILYLLASLALGSSLAAGAPAKPQVDDSVPSRVAAEGVYASEDFQKWLEAANPGDVYEYETGNIRVLEDPKESDSKKRKVVGDSVEDLDVPLPLTPGGPAYSCWHETKVTVQTNVDAAGIWWSGWKKASPCTTCPDGSEAGCNLHLDYTREDEMVIDGEFDQNGIDDALATINKTPSWNRGLKWATKVRRSGILQCLDGSPVSVWVQTTFGWANIAQRYVRRATTREPFCMPDELTTTWKFSHIDWPVEDDDDTRSANVGCSYGANAEC